MVGYWSNAYVNSNLSDIAVAWNTLRRDVIKRAVEKKLLPALEKEMRAKLLQEAVDVVLGEAADE